MSVIWAEFPLQERQTTDLIEELLCRFERGLRTIMAVRYLFFFARLLYSCQYPHVAKFYVALTTLNPKPCSPNYVLDVYTTISLQPWRHVIIRAGPLSCYYCGLLLGILSRGYTVMGTIGDSIGFGV